MNKMEVPSQKVYVVFGAQTCILNRTQTQRMRNYLGLNGYTLTSDLDEADMIFFSGCAATGSAELYNLNELAYIEKRVDKNNSGQKIILFSCLPTINKRTKGEYLDNSNVKRNIILEGKFKNDPNARFIYIDTYDFSLLDQMVGHTVKFRDVPVPTQISAESGMEAMQLALRALKNCQYDGIQEFKNSYVKQAGLQAQLKQLGCFFSVTCDFLQTYGYHSVTIGNGCIHNCAFCSVKFGKYMLKSNPLDEILDNITKLNQKGINKFLLLCDDLGSWGREFKSNFTVLLKAISALKIKDIKLALYNVKINDVINERKLFDQLVDEGLISYMGIMNQHVDPSIIQRMNRQPFDENEFLDIINSFGDKGVNIHVHHIIGFPGETEEQFQRLLNFVSNIKTPNCGIMNLPYSPRGGTKAYEYTDVVPEDIKMERVHRMNLHNLKVASERFNVFPKEVKDTLLELMKLFFAGKEVQEFLMHENQQQTS
jgi:tRNA A37 methylthiotransferase MiaB